MTIEKNVLVRLRVEGGAREGQAFADMAKGAKKLEGDAKRAGGVIAGMVKEMRRTGDAEKEIKRVTDQLKAMGIAADKARAAATKLVNEVGRGARIAEQDVRRLATGMRAVGQAGAAGGRLSGMMGRLSGGAGLGGNLAVGALGLSAANQFQQNQATSVDAQIQEQVRQMVRQMGAADQGGMAISQGIGALPGFSAVASGLSASARQQAERSQQETDAATRRAEQRRRVTASSQAALAAEDRDRRATEDLAFRSRLGAGLAPMAGAETATVRAARLRQQEVMAGQLVTRGGQVTRELDMGAARREIGNRPQQGGTAMAQIEAERQELLRQAAEARRVGQLGQGGTARFAGENVALDRELESIQRVEEGQRRLLELEQRRSQVIRERSAAERQYFDEWRAWAAQAQENYRTLAEQERARIGTLREQFGLMDEMQRQEILQVSRAVRGGGPLTREQEDVIIRNREIFGDRARQIGEQRGRAGGFEEVLGNVGLDARQRDAERRAREAGQLRQQLEANINRDLRVGEGQRAREAAAREQGQMGNIGQVQRERQALQRQQQAVAQGGGLVATDAELAQLRAQTDAMLRAQRAGQPAGLPPPALPPLGQPPPGLQPMAPVPQLQPPPGLPQQPMPGLQPQGQPAMLTQEGPGLLREIIAEIRQLPQPVNEQVTLLRDLVAEVRQLRQQPVQHQLTVQFQAEIMAELNVEAGEIARQVGDQVAPKLREATAAMVNELRRQIEQFQQDQAANQVI